MQQQVIAQNEAKGQVLHDFLQKTYVPRLNEHLNQTDKYLKAEANDYQRFQGILDKLEQDIFEKKNQLGKIVKQLNDKQQSEKEKYKKAETYKKGKKEELAAIQKALDSTSSLMKETCSKIDANALDAIKELPPGMDVFMSQLFHVIYNESKEKFIWKDFKERVFSKEKGTDFQSRMANFQFRTSKEKEDFLKQMNQDPQFQKVLQDQKYVKAFIDIADWIQLTCSGIDNQKKKDEAQLEYDKVDKDFTQRKKDTESLEKTLEFWQSSLNYADSQLTYLNQLKPKIGDMGLEIENSKQKLEGHMTMFFRQTQELNNQLKIQFK